MARATLGSLVVSLGLDAAEFTAGLTKSEYQTKKLASSFKSATRDMQHSLETLNKGLGLVGITLGLHELVDGMKEVITAAAEEERSLNQLNAVLKATGNAAGFTAKQLGDMAEELQGSTIFDDDEIRQAQTALLRFRDVQGSVFEESMKLGADLASAMGMKLPEAYQLLGRAISDPERGMRGLKDAGVRLSQQSIDNAARLREMGDAAGAAKIILEELEKSVGGAGEANTKGLAGAIARATRAWEDLKKSVGKKVEGEGFVSNFTAGLNRIKTLIEDPSFKGDLFDIIRLIEKVTAVSTFRPPGREAAGKIKGQEELTPEETAARNAARIAQIKAQWEQMDDDIYERRKKALQQEAGLVAQLNQAELQLSESRFDKERELASGAYAQNLIDADRYYDKLAELAGKSASQRVVALSEEIRSQRAILEAVTDKGLPQFNPEERRQAEIRILAAELQIQTTLVQRDREQLAIENQRIEAARKLRDEFAEINAEVLAAQGRPVEAAMAQFDNARRQQIEHLQAVAATGGTDASERAQDALRQIDYLRTQAETQAKLTEITRRYSLVLAQVSNEQERIALAHQTGAITELESLDRLSQANQKRLAELQKLYEAGQKELEGLSGEKRDAALQALDDMKLKMEELAASTDLVAKKFTDVFTTSVTNALDMLVEGGHKASEIFKQLEKDIVRGISHIVNQNLAETLFKPGNLGGVGDFFAKLFGFGGKAGDAGGTAALTTASTTLTTAATTLDASGITLDAAGASLAAAAASLEVAATSMMASGVAGGGGDVASLFGSGSEFPGYASGTSYARGGWAMVGERGPEMVRLPRGAQVIPNDVLKAKRATLHQTNNITIAGSTTTKTADQIAVAVGQATRRALMRNA